MVEVEDGPWDFRSAPHFQAEMRVTGYLEKCFFRVRAPSLPQGLDEQVPQKPEGLDLPLQLAVLKAKGSPIYCKQQSMFS